MINQFVWRLLLNAAWQIPLCALICWCFSRLMRRWPAGWTTALWRSTLLLSAVLPVITALWNPLRPASGGMRLEVLATALGGPVAAVANARAIPWIAVAYVLFTAFLAARLAWRWWSLRNLNEETVSVPVAFGIREPRVILPRSFRESAPEIARNAALAHENVHVKNNDFVVNLLLEVITLPVAFHPLLNWIKRRTVEAVEMRCDERAAQMFEDPKQYALGLIEAARILGTPPAPCLTASFFDHDTFEERVMNLTKMKNTPVRWARFAMAASLVLAGTLVFSVSSGFAAAPLQDDERVHKIGEEGVKAPKVTYRVEPEYSESAREAKVSGTTVLSVQIAPNGKAENIRVLRSLEETLDKAAIEAVEQWEFQPATKDDVPVRVQATIEVNFRLK